MTPRAACVVVMLAAALASCDRPAPPPSGQPLAVTQQAAKPASTPRIPPKSAWPFLDASAAAPTDAGFDPALVIKRNYFFVLDASGSMADQKCSGNERKIDVAKRALMQFALHIPADANLGGLVFDQQGVHSLIPIGPLDPKTLQRALRSVSADGQTPLAQAIREAYDALTRRAMAQLGYGEYHLIVVTDGEATGEDPRGVVNRLIAESPVVLHTIGFCIGEKHSLNQPGRTLYHAADNPQQLEQGLQGVLAESPTFRVDRFK
jgi:Ca-activated chloride channel family protein